MADQNDAISDTVTSESTVRDGGEWGDIACRSRFGTFSECQLCGGPLTPEHAHFKCRACGWRDSCCD